MDVRRGHGICPNEHIPANGHDVERCNKERRYYSNAQQSLPPIMSSPVIYEYMGEEKDNFQDKGNILQEARRNTD
jgi:hypothetical protein